MNRRSLFKLMVGLVVAPFIAKPKAREVIFYFPKEYGFSFKNGWYMKSYHSAKLEGDLT